MKLSEANTKYLIESCAWVFIIFIMAGCTAIGHIYNPDSKPTIRIGADNEQNKKQESLGNGSSTGSDKEIDKRE